MLKAGKNGNETNNKKLIKTFETTSKITNNNGIEINHPTKSKLSPIDKTDFECSPKPAPKAIINVLNPQV